MNPIVYSNLKSMGNILAGFLGNQMFWLLMWAGVTISLMRENFFLGVILFLSGLSKFYLLCRKEYLKEISKGD